jgi:hypothetical protein
MRYHLRQAAKPQRCFVWALVSFLGIQAGASIVTELGYPDLYDPQYGKRAEVLRARMAERPRGSWLLVVGSSRTMMAFCPERIAALEHADSGRPLCFNFAHIGAGPFLEYLQVRRLVKQGIRPDWMVIEILPAYLSGSTNVTFLRSFVRAGDLSVSRRYFHPAKAYGYYLWDRLGGRPLLLRRLADKYLVGPPPKPGKGEYDVEPFGGYPFTRTAISPEDATKALAAARSEYQDALQHYFICPKSDWALRELLGLCRRNRIAPILLVSPEGPELRSWYCPGAREQLRTYLSGIERDFNVPVIDAQDWLEEAEFYDSHHALRRGAEKFTARFAREVLTPLTLGTLRAKVPESAGAEPIEHQDG